MHQTRKPNRKPILSSIHNHCTVSKWYVKLYIITLVLYLSSSMLIAHLCSFLCTLCPVMILSPLCSVCIIPLTDLYLQLLIILYILISILCVAQKTRISLEEVPQYSSTLENLRPVLRSSSLMIQIPSLQRHLQSTSLSLSLLTYQATYHQSAPW